MSAAGFDTPANLPPEAGLSLDLIKHERIGDDLSAEQVWRV